jgi:RNA polymerase sigma-70 factor (ECF subfamily)
MGTRAIQDQRYTEAVGQFGPALQRLARAHEANPERVRDLLQEIHIALWRSFALFDERCALRTWVFRVAHNTIASHIDKERRVNRASITLDEIEHFPDGNDISAAAETTEAINKLNALIRQLKAPDRQVLTLYLEGLDAAAIADVTGLTAGGVATRISRLKTHLAKSFQATSPEATHA